jgi:MarR family 2-MHQ and catechol resistance regulon transcriptional repressor
MAASSPWEPLAQDVSLLPVLRQLVECHTLFERAASRLVETQGLTLPQFDVLVTLGDLPGGLTTKEVGEQSLTTKGSLLPILDRLEARGLVHRRKGEKDSRQTIVALTAEGQALYEHAFTAHLAAMCPKLDVLSSAEQTVLVRLLQQLKTAFQ